MGADRASLFGFSDAGALCAMFAATHPESVSGLIMYASAARGTQAPDYPWQWSEQEWHDYLVRLRAAYGTGEYAEESLPFFNPSLAGDASMLAWWERFQRSSASPNGIYAQEQVYRDMDIRKLLPAIGVPTLVLHRADDEIEPVGAGRFIAGEIADAEFVELPGADHFPWAGEQEALIVEVERFLERVRSEEDEAFDRVLATILFTDIVDSTAQAATMGDRRWREVREQHDRVTRAQLARFRGREVKTLGDGFLAVFDGPARGVRCARAICASVGRLGVELRAGLHTGEIQPDGDDIAGIAVAIGARVGALAEPSEVLVSSTVKDLVVGVRPVLPGSRRAQSQGSGRPLASICARGRRPRLGASRRGHGNARAERLPEVGPTGGPRRAIRGAPVGDQPRRPGARDAEQDRAGAEGAHAPRCSPGSRRSAARTCW